MRHHIYNARCGDSHGSLPSDPVRLAEVVEVVVEVVDSDRPSQGHRGPSQGAVMVMARRLAIGDCSCSRC